MFNGARDPEVRCQRVEMEEKLVTQFVSPSPVQNLVASIVPSETAVRKVEMPDDMFEGDRKPLMTLKRETIDIYDPDRLARVIGAFAEAGLIPAEILAGFLIEDASQAAHH